MELRGRSALVTGATGGLGRAIARRLAREGCAVTVSGRRADELAGLAEEVGGRAIVADLAEAGAAERVAAECSDVDIVVANAGLPGNGALEEYTVEQVDRVLDVNLRAPVVLARLIGERMLERGGGHLVFVSSLSGKAASPLASLYNATKFGLRGFALALRNDWRPRGVGVSCVNPGPIAEAGMFHDGGARLPGWITMKTPGDVAGAVVTAIRRDRAEIDVADLATRAGATLALVAPRVAARLSSLGGADEIARQLAEGHRGRR
jgi:uncharacterized protein